MDDQKALRAVLSRIADDLGGIRTVLAVLLNGDPDEPAAPNACLHPMEQRIDFGVTNGRPDFQCRVCGHREVVEAN